MATPESPVRSTENPPRSEEESQETPRLGDRIGGSFNEPDVSEKLDATKERLNEYATIQKQARAEANSLVASNPTEGGGHGGGHHESMFSIIKGHAEGILDWIFTPMFGALADSAKGEKWFSGGGGGHSKGGGHGGGHGGGGAAHH